MVKIVSDDSDLPSVQCETCHLTVAYDVTMYDVDPDGDVRCPGCWEILPLKIKNELSPKIIDDHCKKCKIADSCDHDKGSLPCIAFNRKIKKKEPVRQQSLAQFIK